MKGIEKKKERQDQPGSANQPVPARGIDGKKHHKTVRKYPDKVGYHGTDEEKDLSPEE
jgi:hypothetical protein